MIRRRTARHLVAIPFLLGFSFTLAGCIGDLFHSTEWHSAYCFVRTPEENDCAVDDELGIFVRTDGDDNGFGTVDEPVRTLSRAISLAQASQRHVFACAGTYAEGIALPPGVNFYGGLDCSEDTWTWKDPGARTVIQPAAGTIPIVIQKGAVGTRVENVDAVSVAAQDPGDSAIAFLVDHASVRLRHVSLKAGKGATGGRGDKASEIASSGVDGMPGAAVNPQASTAPGGAQVSSTCDRTMSIGGAGGDGGVNHGAFGLAGSPTGGAGGDGTDWTTGSPKFCTAGQPGERGADGMPGAGATGLGTLSNLGFLGPAGATGGRGSPGGGGGGGGGGAATAFPGGGGGSGGTGGCGGVGGGGGHAGGASIGLISLDSALSFYNVTIATADGGAGGEGSPGATGGGGGEAGKGGTYGDVSPRGCKGGAGGNGGTGGGGGGGLGGHSLGIVFTGHKVAPTGASITRGAAGQGGFAPLGGTRQGEAGVSADVKTFDTGM